MQKLEELEVTKVAFVPEGDNRKADILLFKSKPEGADGGKGIKSDPVSDEKETNTLKRFFLAMAKAMGFEKADDDPEADDDNDNGDENRSGDGAAGDPAVNGEGEGNKDNDLPDDNDATGKTVDTKKGVTADMKFDKSKLTAEEIAQLEAIEKKAGISEGGGSDNNDGVQKNAADSTANDNVNKDKPETNDADDIYKGLNPLVAAELKELRKRADVAEERELLAVAKKYELLGKKPEELAVTLKSLKTAGGTAYDDMIGVLDASLAAVEKSGAFGEVGRSGNGGKADPWAQIENHAAEIQKAKPDMTWNQAVDKACEQHPELVAEYEQKR